MKLIRVLLAAIFLVALACSTKLGSNGASVAAGSSGSVGAVGQNGSATGKIGVALSLGHGVTLASLGWTIQNSRNTYAGTVHVGGAQSVEWVAGGILVGSGYTLYVDGLDSEGDWCAGQTSSTFSIGAGVTTQVALAITCTVPTDASVAADVDGGTGTVGAALSTGSITLTTLDWVIHNGENSYSGTVHIGDAQSIEWVAGGILAGSGYTLSVDARDSAGDTCIGQTPSTFVVNAGATTYVALAVTCTLLSDATIAADVHTGSVEFDASVSVVTQGPTECPGILAVSIDPAAQIAGVPVQLGVATTGPASVVSWSVTPAADGTFSDPTAVSPTFTCLNTNDNPLILTATLALPDSDACTGQAFTTMSARFNCQ